MMAKAASPTARLRLACFVSPHGLGHAARVAAVLSQLARLRPLQLEIYGASPAWIYAQSLDGPWSCQPLETDVGCVQRSAVEEDLPATLERLRGLLPFEPLLVEGLARDLQRRGCNLVLCDISALGIAVARRAGIPSVLLENFTWDWIYAAYTDRCPALADFGRELARVYDQADLRLQAEPVCVPKAGACGVGLIARSVRQPSHEVRRLLGVREGQKLVLLTMGGAGGSPDTALLEALCARSATVFLLPGPVAAETWRENLRLLPAAGRWYHPDLASASDLIVGKLGYSTLAEAMQAGTPFAVVARALFPEAAVLEEYAMKHLAVQRLALNDWASGAWLEHLPDLLGLPRVPARPAPGAEEAANALVRVLDGI